MTLPFQDEIIPVQVPQKRAAPLVVEKDEGPRDNTTIEKQAKLRPIFKEGGTATAGNASTINGAAAGVLVMSQRKAIEEGLTPLRHLSSGRAA